MSSGPKRCSAPRVGSSRRSERRTRDQRLLFRGGNVGRPKSAASARVDEPARSAYPPRIEERCEPQRQLVGPSDPIGPEIEFVEFARNRQALDPDSKGDLGCIFSSHKNSVASLALIQVCYRPGGLLSLKKQDMLPTVMNPQIMRSASSTAERSDPRGRTPRSRAQSRTDAAKRGAGIGTSCLGLRSLDVQKHLSRWRARTWGPEQRQVVLWAFQVRRGQLRDAERRGGRPETA